MKKLKVISVVLILVMALALVGDCSSLAAVKTMKVWMGSGQNTAFRVGPGKDVTGTPVYSFNIMLANATFDKNGKILDVYFDAYEISTPNYDGASMPHISGWPGTPGYNVAEHVEGKIVAKSANTEASIAAEVNAWKTKRERGDNYHMNDKNEWYKQVNFMQNFFRGKTVAEIEAWFAKNCSDLNGRPLKVPTETTKPEDKAKYEKLTAAEKKVLADVVAGATISFKDAHGDFLSALKEAYAKRYEVTIPVQ